jgi:hypothetical protein
MSPATIYLLGALAMGCLVAAMFFFRFHRDTGDRLFLWFGISFFVEGLNRSLAALQVLQPDETPVYYGIRFVAYLFILWAIAEKMFWPRRRAPDDDE